MSTTPDEAERGWNMLHVEYRDRLLGELRDAANNLHQARLLVNGGHFGGSANELMRVVSAATRAFAAASALAALVKAEPLAKATWVRPDPNSVVARFTGDELACLVMTAGEAVHGNHDDLSTWQRELAMRAYELYQADMGDNDGEGNVDG